MRKGRLKEEPACKSIARDAICDGAPGQSAFRQQ